MLNAGSSSWKFALFAAEDGCPLIARGQVDGIGKSDGVSEVCIKDAHGTILAEQQLPPSDHQTALQAVLESFSRDFNHLKLFAVGHRVVHGGTAYARPVRVDHSVVTSLSRLIPLAPLHQPHNLAAIRMLRDRYPDLPQVACFDTAFHRTMPEIAQRFAVPRRFHDEGIRRYGFHGLSYESVASVLAEYDSRASQGRTIIAHLGHGASLCALQAGRSITTTMSFTPLDGLVMGTRPGSLDPGVILYWLRQGFNIEQLEQLLYHESGLLGVSGLSSDMRTLLTSADPRAAEAIDLFIERIVQAIGALVATLEGLDALVFTGGIGENAAPIRERILHRLQWLGSITTLVIPSNEELMIARHTWNLTR